MKYTSEQVNTGRCDVGQAIGGPGRWSSPAFLEVVVQQSPDPVLDRCRQLVEPDPGAERLTVHGQAPCRSPRPVPGQRDDLDEVADAARRCVIRGSETIVYRSRHHPGNQVSVSRFRALTGGVLHGIRIHGLFMRIPPDPPGCRPTLTLTAGPPEGRRGAPVRREGATGQCRWCPIGRDHPRSMHNGGVPWLDGDRSAPTSSIEWSRPRVARSACEGRGSSAAVRALF